MFDEQFLQAQRNRALREVYPQNAGGSINVAMDDENQDTMVHIPPVAGAAEPAVFNDSNGGDGIDDDDDDSDITRSLPIKKKLGETVVTLVGIFKRTDRD